jgi:hypothetical protein
MSAMVWIGTGLTITGVVLLLACIALALRARRSGLADAALRAALQRLVALNLGALMLSALGLIVVIVGIALE